MKASTFGKFAPVSVLVLGTLLCSPLAAVPQVDNSLPKKCKPLGSQTDAFFEEVAKRKQQLKPGAPSQEDPYSMADLNRDGRCNRTDLKLFRRVLGRCAKLGSPALIGAADFDGDNCVTTSDKRSFLQLWQACRSRNKSKAGT